jgi:hypothetical protein
MNNIENMSDIRQDLCDLPLRKPRTKEGQSAPYIYMHQFWSPLRHWPDWVWEVGSPCRQIRRPVDMGQRGVRGMVLQQEQQLDILNLFRATYMPSTNIK